MQVRLVILDGEEEVAVGVEEHPRQRPLGEQSVGREEAEHRVVIDELRQGRLERLRLGGLAAGDGELAQTESQFVGEDVEHVDRVAVGVVPLPAGLAVGCGGHGRGGLWEADEPPREGVAELLEREARQGPTDRRGVGRPLAREAEDAAEDPPVVGGPPLQAGEVGLSGEQSEERQGEDRRERMADPPPLTGIVNLGEGVEQRGKSCVHP